MHKGDIYQKVNIASIGKWTKWPVMAASIDGRCEIIYAVFKHTGWIFANWNISVFMKLILDKYSRISIDSVIINK